MNAPRPPGLLEKRLRPTSQLRDAHRRAVPCLDIASNSAIRWSKSSNSMAFDARSRTTSAARTRLDVGASGSTMILTRTETAALDACCNRAMDCEKAGSSILPAVSGFGPGLGRSPKCSVLS
jgi:hypothetical protein